ncbi:hypothetical protein FNV43_RR16423 [Rhamnella rubrinervis]|uniref:Uncharacterized protein n=1 Tax=Rhamnella rubrinervis TaxID=2594499 RepID=A0A8K0MD18_9ROSA|nr:hypothetical protein FNV43_RR16423 [Rhamnella rubrinervis]
MSNLPPGSMGWPFLGETLQLYSQNPNLFFATRQKSRYSPVYACNAGVEGSVRLALTHRVLKVEGYLLMNPVFKAALNGSNDENSSENINWDVDQKAKYQENTVLHAAAKSGNQKTAENILGRQPSLQLQQNKKLDTPLHIAARLGCGSEILKKKDDFGWLPLHYAAQVGNIQVVKLFLTNNIDLAYGKIDDKEGMSALHIAAKKGLKEHIGVIRTLVEECPDVCELVDNRDRTALHVAVESGNRYAVKTLLNMPEFNDLINEQDKDGNKSLHLAAFDVTRHAILIMLATDGRMETAILNEMGMTAIDIISTNTQLSKLDKAFMISMLEEKGYTPSLERRIVVRETKSVDENIQGHERLQQTTRRLKMPAKDEAVASGSGLANTGRENNKEKHHVTPNGNDKPYHHIRNIGGSTCWWPQSLRV